MRVLVTGGRDYMDFSKVASTLDEVGPSEICQGGARGADSLAARWADAYDVPCKTYEARWDLYGKRAGMIRNRTMCDDFKPDLVVAFPGGRGTAGMVAYARTQGVPVRVVE